MTYFFCVRMHYGYQNGTAFLFCIHSPHVRRHLNGIRWNVSIYFVERKNMNPFPFFCLVKSGIFSIFCLRAFGINICVTFSCTGSAPLNYYIVCARIKSVHIKFILSHNIGIECLSH